MYERFFGLRERPFELTPNPKYLYLSAHHREAVSNLKYGLLSSKSVTLLLGAAGTGKTTVLHTVLESSDCRHVRCVSVNNPALTRDEFIQVLAAGFELGDEARRSKAVLLEGLERGMRERRARGEITALVIDEAQALSRELLEEVRLLANIETSSEKLLPVVLAGQRELGERLEDPSLAQLKQRVALRCEILPFDLPDTAAYITARIAAADGTPGKLFTREAVMLIHEYSNGVPRTINVICDNALVTGMALRRQPVDRRTVLEVCGQFCLHPGEQSAPLSKERAQTITEPEPSHREAPEEAVAASGTRADLFEAVIKPRRFALFGYEPV